MDDNAFWDVAMYNGGGRSAAGRGKDTDTDTDTDADADADAGACAGSGTDTDGGVDNEQVRQSETEAARIQTWHCIVPRSRGTSWGQEQEQELQMRQHQKEEVYVTISETRGDGVMDEVGAYLWPAALLLSAHMLLPRHRRTFQRASVLELGAGVGLCGLLLLQLKAATADGASDPIPTSKGSVGAAEGAGGGGGGGGGGSIGGLCFTDIDPAVLSSLRRSVRAAADNLQVQVQEPPFHSHAGAAATAATTAGGLGDVEGGWATDGFRVEVALFDWQDVGRFMPDADAACSNNDNALGGSPSFGDYDILIGSALAYTDDHAVMLLNVLESLICGPGRCNEAHICQIVDRPGFARLLQLVEESPILRVQTLEGISDQVYGTAQGIGERQLPTVDGSSFFDKVFAMPLERVERAERAEGGAMPLELERAEGGGGDSLREREHEYAGAGANANAYRRGLLKASRDSFRIVIIVAA